ncbi:translation elongation factor 2 (EF-2/EF-G) [Oceanotoga teriensis]|uniref:Translation elongation factor 2 (EF-2/EF-G) n=1 Tax=Oceanotoga teriensis TaxID=515440 RepID=A0AA45C9C3_9BACT|nr:elongation factor G [Oceanotoga teriensis]PWJ96715.1 translation elongation factor 2 (EF-2/EF-G) [Oceanotoga teriensis]
MGNLSSSQKRIIGVFGHHLCGKTTIMDALLKEYYGVDRIGQRYLDKDEIEKQKKSTFTNHIITINYQDIRTFFIDTPGSADFLGDINTAINAVDNVLLVINAASGIEVTTERVYKVAKEMNKPVIFFVNGLDKEGVKYGKVIEELKEKFEDGAKLVPFQIPIGEGENFKGLVNLLTKKSYIYEKDFSGKAKEIDGIEEEAKEYFEKYHSELIEDIVETNESLMEKYFEGGEESISAEELLQSLHNSLESDQIIPVLGGSALQNIGVDRILNAVKKFGMASNERTFEFEDGETIKPVEDAEMIGMVIKNDVDPFVGRISYIRILSGKMKSVSNLYVVDEEKIEKTAHIYLPGLEKNEEIEEASAGDIILIPKLKSCKIGYTLREKNEDKKVMIPEYPEPMISKSINPKSKNEIDKITSSLQKLSESDKTFTWEYDAETGETIVNGIGEVHLEVMLEKLKKNFGVDFEVGKPKIAYRETIKKPMKAEYKHKKQTGGHGQYGHVKLEIEPLERGTGYEFVDKIVGGVIPKNFIPSVDKGIKEALKNGVLAGFPVVDVKVTLYDGSYHAVDSSDIAFQIAARSAFKEAVKNASPVLLEPIMSVEVFVPNEYTGDVMGEVTAKRGRPMGMEAVGKGTDKINAEIPLAEMMDFSPRLNSLSSGKGYFNMKFSHYMEISPDIQNKIVEEFKVEE